MAIMSLRIEQTGLIEIKAEGEFTGRELKTYSLMALVNNTQPLILWNISKGSVSSLTRQEIRDAANQVSSFEPKVDGGKIAFVANCDSDFAILRVYETYIDLTNLPILCKIFYTLSDARAWLSHESPSMTEALTEFI